MKIFNSIKFLPLVLFVAMLASSTVLKAQFETKWMSAGSLHNWYSAIGCEIEEGLERRQQYGLRWPAIYQYQDMQAAKGLWIGAADFTDENGRNYDHKVVHVGPRVSGGTEFFPMEFGLTNKIEPPVVTVDGVTSFQLPVDSDVEPDNTLPYDRVITNVTNTQLGITMERKIYQFSQEYHDNYIIQEYTLTNTGNVDDDADIELPGQTLKDVYAFFQYRLAICQNTRYVIGNGTGWGMNTMLDRTGTPNDPLGSEFRSVFAWHGKFPPFVTYDNVGGPIWQPDGTIYTSDADTVGRLGASQFVGVVTLHADASATDSTDDPTKPKMTYRDSDHPLTSNNDAFNAFKMSQEYDWMDDDNVVPYHAWKVEPQGNFTEPTGDPAQGTSGGFSAATSYGPYDLAPGESVKFVWAEAAAGLSRERNIEIGRRFKSGQITAKEKNEFVFQSRDSLFQTFRRAIANYNDGNGFTIPQPPRPPKSFTVTSGGDRISLAWEVYEEGDPQITGFEIYRAAGQYDSTYYMIHSAGASERSYDDLSPTRGVNYYYYIVTVGDPANNTGQGLTPPGALRSSRYYTQTYDPANLKRPAGESLSDIRVVPNPYIISSNPQRLRFDGEPDKLAFFNIPGQCNIKIYTELGELIYELEHSDGSGDAYWNCVTSSNQIIVSGIYIAVITDSNSGEKHITKFAVIR